MKKSNVKLLFEFLRGSKMFFIFAVLSALGIVLTDMITPQIVKFTIDTVIGGEEPTLPKFIVDFILKITTYDAIREKLWYLAVVVLINAVLSVIFRYTFRVYNSLGAETLAQTMRNRIFDHIEHLPFSWHMKNKTGDIIQRCTSDVDMIKNFLSEQLTTVFRIVILLALSITFMFSISVKLAIIAVAFVPVILAGSVIFQRFVHREFLVCDENEGHLSSIVQENLTGVRVVRAFGRELYEKERFDKQNEHYCNLWVRLSRFLSTYWSTADLLAGIQIMLIIVFGAYMCIDGTLSTGAYVAFISYNAYLTWPVRQLGRTLAEMSKAGVSLGRIGEIVNADIEKDPEDTQSADMRGDIVFENVTFSYDDTHKILNDVSFKIPAGTTLGILGGTGSGKSTITYLLDKLYPVTDGKITIGGTDISKIKMHDLRSNIGLVLQEPFLFSRSLKENIAMSAKDSSDEEIRKAVDIACLSDTINSFTQGYETFVGERGVTLSGGQKQRTAIARMLMQNAPIMIFDDSLSAVDAETDAKIRSALNEKMGSSTVILISHRTNTRQHADNILVLDHGKIAECGKHEELLNKNGLYRRIYDIQNGTEAVSND